MNNTLYINTGFPIGYEKTINKGDELDFNQFGVLSKVR